MTAGQSEHVTQASVAPAVPPEPRFYSPQLDGLRFIAALLVFMQHAPQLPGLDLLYSYGWIGVDFFLSISAFLITRLILLEHQKTGGFSLKAFYIRRALRIWPLYLTYVTGASLLFAFAADVGHMKVLAWWLSHLSFTNNVMTAAQGFSPVWWTGHLWTISLEEQAYLMMPLLLSAYLLGGSNVRHAAYFCIASLLVLLLARLALVLVEVQHPFIYVLPLRGDSFLIGALAAILTHGRQIKHAGWLMVAGLLLVCLVTLFPPVHQLSAYHVIGYTITAAGCTAIVLGSQADGVSRKILGCGPMRYLGKISYGIYVYHVLGLDVARRTSAFGLSEAVTFWAGLALTIAVAALSYQLLERPFLLLKERYAKVASRPA